VAKKCHLKMLEGIFHPNKLAGTLQALLKFLAFMALIHSCSRLMSCFLSYIPEKQHYFISEV